MADQVSRNQQGSTFDRNDTKRAMPSRDLDKSQRESEQRDVVKKSDGADQQQRNRRGLDDKT